MVDGFLFRSQSPDIHLVFTMIGNSPNELKYRHADLERFRHALAQTDVSASASRRASIEPNNCS